MLAGDVKSDVRCYSSTCCFFLSKTRAWSSWSELVLQEGLQNSPLFFASFLATDVFLSNHLQSQIPDSKTNTTTPQQPACSRMRRSKRAGKASANVASLQRTSQSSTNSRSSNFFEAICSEKRKAVGYGLKAG